MVVVNKRGGGGALAMNYFMTRPADGNTIMTFTETVHLSLPKRSSHKWDACSVIPDWLRDLGIRGVPPGSPRTKMGLHNLKD